LAAGAERAAARDSQHLMQQVGLTPQSQIQITTTGTILTVKAELNDLGLGLIQVILNKVFEQGSIHKN
jgi:hypothetical protein